MQQFHQFQSILRVLSRASLAYLTFLRLLNLNSLCAEFKLSQTVRDNYDQWTWIIYYTYTLGNENRFSHNLSLPPLTATRLKHWVGFLDTISQRKLRVNFARRKRLGIYLSSSYQEITLIRFIFFHSIPSIQFHPFNQGTFAISSISKFGLKSLFNHHFLAILLLISNLFIYNLFHLYRQFFFFKGTFAISSI